MKKIDVYTDGACSGNPGPGGWGAVLMYEQHRKEISGYVPSTTNNRMELTAVIEALSLLKEPCEVTVYSDSAYVVNGFVQGWVFNWAKRGWCKADRTPVENPDLWKTLLALTQDHAVHFVKVKGHASNVENNRCDALATGAIQQARQR